MGKFDDFDIDLKENKNGNDVEPRLTSAVCFSINVSLEACTTAMSKVTCGESGNCNITKISKCTGR